MDRVNNMDTKVKIGEEKVEDKESEGSGKTRKQKRTERMIKQSNQLFV